MTYPTQEAGTWKAQELLSGVWYACSLVERQWSLNTKYGPYPTQALAARKCRELNS